MYSNVTEVLTEESLHLDKDALIKRPAAGKVGWRDDCVSWNAGDGALGLEGESARVGQW